MPRVHQSFGGPRRCHPRRVLGTLAILLLGRVGANAPAGFCETSGAHFCCVFERTTVAEDCMSNVATAAHWNYCPTADIAREVYHRPCYDATGTTTALPTSITRASTPATRLATSATPGVTPATLAACVLRYRTHGRRSRPQPRQHTLEPVSATLTPVPSDTPALDLATLVPAATSPVPTLTVLTPVLSIYGMRCSDAEATCL